MATVLQEHDQRVVFHNVRWETYRTLLADEGISRARMAFDQGTLEIMSPSHKHENINNLIGRMIETLTMELDIELHSAGSTTLLRADLESGVEPDTCYYLSNSYQIRESDEILLPDNPPPDLAIEVDISRSSLVRRRIYAKLGILETWRFAGDRLEMYRLNDEGEYSQIERSMLLPQLGVSDLQRFLALRGTLSETQLLRQFRDWVRENFGAK